MMGGFTMTAFYLAVVINVPLSLLLLVLYRRAVARAMQTTTGAPSADSAPRQENMANKRVDAELVIDVIDADKPISTSNAQTTCSARVFKSATVVYVAAGTLFVLVIVLGWQLTLGGKFLFIWFLWWLVLNAWPIPLTVGLINGAADRDWIRLWVLYASVFVTISATCLALYVDLDIPTLVSNALTTILIAIPVIALLYRPVRAVAMLVLMFTLLILTISPPLGYATLQNFTDLADKDGIWQLPALFLLSMLHAKGVVILIVFLMIVITGVVGWWTLNRIGRAYRNKRLSDQSLLIDSMWAIVALSNIMLLSTQGEAPGESWGWIIFPTAAFAVYWLTRRFGLALLTHATVSPDAAPLLLLLRVFSLGKRSERLFSILTPRWLRTGGMALIAGPDLATGTVQPNQFLEYLARRIRRQFIKDDSDLGRRLANLDLRPDPDGRYRINQFFCFANTWQNAVLQLSQQADMVLMDLRNFSANNQGCLYELEMLREHVHPNRMLLLVDSTTDWPFVEATLHRLWTGTPGKASGTDVVAPRLRVLRLRRTNSKEVDRIIELISNSLTANALDTPTVAAD